MVTLLALALLAAPLAVGAPPSGKVYWIGLLTVPSHCTGWKATHEIARALPDEFIPNSVGTTFLI